MSENTFWIGNGRTVLPNRVCENGSVLVEDGVIQAVNEPCPCGVRQIDAAGGYILPGFIDIHLHGGGRHDFMDGEAEDFIAAAEAHVKHGTTAMVPTTMTCEDEVLEKVIRAFLQAKKAENKGAALLGLHLEGPFFSAAGKGAQPVGEQRVPTREYLERIITLGEGNILRWDEAPELPNTALFGDVMTEHHILAAAAHTAATAEEAEEAFDHGFSHITHLFCVTSTGRKINGICHSGVNEAALIDERVTVELIADGCHIPREHMLLAYKVKGPDKMCLITDAMRAAGTDDRESILGAKVGGVPVVIKDDVAQLPDLSFFAGSVATMDRALRVVHRRYGIPLADTVKMMTLTPARLSGVERRKGSLTVGKDADIVLMDESLTVRKVFVGGILRAEQD